MQNNFLQISNFIWSRCESTTCDNKKYFFNVAVIKRHIDGHKSGNSLNRTIKQYFVSSVEQLSKIEDEIITLCEEFEARAYFDPQLRNWESLAKEMNLELAQRMLSGDFEKIYRVPYRAASKCNREEKLWILDIDNPKQLPIVKEYLYNEVNLRDSTFEEVKTNKGYHIIIPPFDNRGFIEKFPDIEIKKNNMTLLYYPRSLTI